MTNIIVVFPKPEDARSIRNFLMRSGYSVAATCTSGTVALQAVDNLNEGIIVCGYRYRDMLYDELFENLPATFEMLLVASERVIEEGIPQGVTGISMPLKVQELVEALARILFSLERERKKRRTAPRQKSAEELKQIAQAKALLMERNRMSEEEAHRYLQKTSMDSGTNIAETAQMLLSLMKA